MNDSHRTEPQGLADDPSGDVTRTREVPPTEGGETRLKSDTPLPGAFASSAGGPSGGSGAERYQLGPVLARGGMGVVYRAEDLALGREVALKVLVPELAHTSAVGRFNAEARITGQLQHPSIPPVHDLGTLPDGRPFLAMKLIKGRTLAEEIKAHPFDGDDFDGSARVFEQVCLAVAFAHSKGIIHRDLKPANIMVGAFGEVQVMDWGLAKFVARGEPTPVEAGAGEPGAAPRVLDIGSHVGPEDRTEIGEILGTPAYMAPEQTRGKEVDERADVFALGGILCALLTGKPPYTGNSGQEVWENASRGTTEGAMSRLNAVTGAGQFRAIARRCLQPNPVQRFAHAGEVAAAVHAARAKAREVARRDELVGATEDADRLQRRAALLAGRAVKLGLAALALGLTVAVGAACYAQYLDARHEEAAAARAKLDAERQKELFPVLVAAAHRLSDDGAFNPGGDFAERTRFVELLQQSAEHQEPADAAHVHLLLSGLCLIAQDPDTGTHWARAVERYKVVAPDHTETVLAVRAVGWFTRRNSASKLDRTVLLQVRPVLVRAVGNPALPEELRTQAAALGSAK